MQKIVFATNNNHKLKEARALIGHLFEILSLKDIDCDHDLPETNPTIEQNAMQKAVYIYEKFGMNCFADDTGLEVEVLGGRPGVYSARYSGAQASAEANMRKLLTEMKDETNRRARFKTVIALIINDERISFEGIVYGRIATEEIGNSGFGYDPVFIPENNELSFAQMTATEKNKISHRAIAVEKLKEYLNTHFANTVV